MTSKAFSREHTDEPRITVQQTEERGMHPTEIYSALIPPLTLRDGDTLATIATLDEALLFAETHPHPKGDYDGLIRRLQSASETADRIEASNAFKWWAESNAILVDGGLPE